MFLELDKARVKYVLNTSDFTKYYVNFFKKNEKSLRVHKAKFRDVPQKASDAINLFFELPDSTNDILSSFLLTIQGIEIYEYTEWAKNAVSEFRKKEKDDEYEIHPQEEKTFCNTILLEILKPNPSKALIKFLKSPISNIIKTSSSSILSNFSKIANNDKGKKHKDATKNIDDKKTPTHIVTAKELKSITANNFENIIDQNEIEFIVKYLRNENGKHFYRPIALIQDSDMKVINALMAMELFPSRGEVICPQNKYKPGSFLKAVILVSPKKGIHNYQIDKFIDNSKYEEIQDSGATNLDGLRSYMNMNESYIAEHHALIKYQHFIIRPHFQAKKINFSIPCEAFANVIIHKINVDLKHNYLLASHSLFKGSPDSNIDLSDDIARIKKILKKNQYGIWDKSEINKLIAFINEKLDPQVELDLSVLKNIALSEEQQEELITLLIETPQIKNKIDDAIKIKVGEAEKNSEELTERENKLVEERENLDEINKSKLIKFTKDIKATFDEEVLAGKETISKIALFSAFFENNNQNASKSSDVRYQFRSIEHASSKYNNMSVLIPATQSQLVHMYNLIDDARSLSLIPIITGPSSQFFAKLYAYNKELNIDEYIIKNGLNHCSELDSLDLTSAKRISMVINFDIAYFFLYAPYLSERLVMSGLGEANDDKKSSLILISNNDNLKIENAIPELLKHITIQFDPIDIDISSMTTKNSYHYLVEAHIDDDELRASILDILQNKIQVIQDKDRRDKLAYMICNQFNIPTNNHE